ncbi:MAG: HDOD domain-containing protein [Thiotrichales bacterium]|nr:HDOD domain-containing protein [Thiotrichales bacterium]
MSYKSKIDVAEQLLHSVKLPEIPSVVIKLQTLLSESEAPNPDKILNIVSGNPFMAGELVSLANTPCITHSDKNNITDLKAAIHRLGNAFIKNYALSIAIKGMLDDDKIKGLSYHSQKIAFLSAEIAKYSQGIRPDEAYLLGILHDIGSFALAEIDPSYGSTFVGRLANHFEVEQQEFAKYGTTHSALGFVIARSWNIPKSIAQSLLLHHEPQIAAVTHIKLQKFAALIELAHLLSTHQSDSPQTQVKKHALCHSLFEILECNEEDIRKIQTASQH